MQRFRSMKTLQKFSSVHAQVHNHFNQERHLVTRRVYKQRRSAALAVLIRPECFRLEREFAGPGFYRGEQCTLSRRTEQSSREFAPAGATTRAQDAEVQVARISPTLSVRSRSRPQQFQHPASPHIPQHAPRPRRRSVRDVANRYGGLRPTQFSDFRICQNEVPVMVWTAPSRHLAQ